MKNKISILVIASIIYSCSAVKQLKKDTQKLTFSNPSKLIQFQFEEQFGELGHNFKPWETNNYIAKGSLWLQNDIFLKLDTVTNSRGRKYVSKTDYQNNILLYLDYGDANLFSITEEIFYEKIINTARYSPSVVLNYFLENQTKMNIEFSDTHIMYSLKIGDYPTKIFQNKTNKLIDKITYLSYHELYGDITTTFNYALYIDKENLIYPSVITIEKINGKVVDKVTIEVKKSNSNVSYLLDKPENYQFSEKSKEVKPVLKTTKYNDYIHFINLEHTDDRIMVVEFEDYMLVAEAPLNSKNGELIIEEVKKIAPQKPIKYFVFGHHHPHYLGGLRAFVHKEATILCTTMSKEYVEFIANASHSKNPDSLQLEPKKLKTQVITDSLALGDKMKIYFIGEKSAHTIDYLIYYFPENKLLFQDDLCWIANEGPITKAGSRQLGLYNSIIELGLEVDTIIQSWPVNNNKVKTVIPFSELKESVLIKN